MPAVDESESAVADVRRAHPRARRLAIVVLLGAILAGGAGVQVLSSRIESLRAVAETDPEMAIAEIVRLANLLAVVNVVVTATAAVWLLWYAYRVRRSREWPPPDAWLLRDTAIVSGPPAVRRALLLVVAAAVLVGSGGFVSVRLMRTTAHLAESMSVNPAELSPGRAGPGDR